MYGTSAYNSAMMRKRCSYSLYFLAFIGFLSSAWASDVDSMTLPQLARELRAKNPQFVQAEQERQQIQARIPQALAWDQPMIGMEQTPIPRNPANLNQSQGMSYRLTQTMSFPGKKRLAADILEAQAGSASAQIDGLYVSLLAELKQQYYQLLALQQQAEIHGNTLERLKQIKQLTQVRYASNAAAFVDYMNAQVAQGSAENEVYQTQRRLEQVRHGLNTLIGRNPLQELRVAVEPQNDIDLKPLPELMAAAQGQHPVLRDSAYRMEAANKNLALAKKAYYPDMQLVLTKYSNHPPWGLAGNEYGLEIDLVLPTWFFAREKAGVSEANAGVISAQAGAELAWRQMQLDIANAYSQLQQVIKEKELMQQRRLPEAKAAYRLALSTYANNAGEFNALLLAQQNLKDAELAAAWIESALQQTRASLDAALGLGEVI